MYPQGKTIKATPELIAVVEQVKAGLESAMGDVIIGVSGSAAMEFAKLASKTGDPATANAIVQEAIVDRMVTSAVTIGSTYTAPFGGVDLPTFAGALSKGDAEFNRSMAFIARMALSALMTNVVLSIEKDTTIQESVEQHIATLMNEIQSELDNHKKRA